MQRHGPVWEWVWKCEVSPATLHAWRQLRMSPSTLGWLVYAVTQAWFMALA